VITSTILGTVSDLPLSLPDAAAASLLPALDREGKVLRALEALGPIADRDVLVVGGGPVEIARLEGSGSRVVAIDELPSAESVARSAGSADAIVSAWAGFRGVDPAALAEADRILRPGGRLLVIHDYGRDDVSRLRGDLPEYGAWSRRDGPYLANGFRMRVLHCFWTFDTLDDARAFLADAFGDAGTTVGAGLKRPRLSWNVAVYHRTRGGKDDGTGGPMAAGGKAG
jgi:SAM-dependent methyltransferase